MEALVTIVAVGAYAERQYQKQDKNGEERHENAFYITDLQSL